MKTNKVKIIFLISAIIISMSFFSCSIGKEYKNVGDVTKLKNCEITVEKIEKYSYMEYVTPQDGNVFVAIKFNYKNTTDASLEYKSLPIIALMTSDKSSYSVNYDASNVYAIIEGVDYSIMTDPLESNAVREDCEVYEVPMSDLGSKEIVIKLNNTGNYIKVDLSTGAESTTDDTTQNNDTSK
jgi:hypothetical protein